MQNKITNLKKFEDALAQLQKALLEPETAELSIDGTIQRFEFSFELGWKATKDLLLKTQGIDTKSPKPTLQEAYRIGWIKDEVLWVAMLEDRNNTSHTYDKELARAIYRRIKDTYTAALKQLLNHLKTL